MCIEKKDQTLKALLDSVDDQVIFACYPHDICHLAHFCANWLHDACFTVYTGDCNEDDSIRVIAAIVAPLSIIAEKPAILDVLSRQMGDYFEPKIKVFALHGGEMATGKILSGCAYNHDLLEALKRWNLLKGE